MYHPFNLGILSQGTLWTPSEIVTDLWFDANDADTITEVTGVSQWDDKSTDGTRDATQGTGASQPVYSSANKTITFDGSDDSLSIANTPSTGTFHIYMVANMDSTDTTQRLMGNDLDTTYLPILASGNPSTNVFRIDNSDDPAGLELYTDGDGTPITRTRAAFFTELSDTLKLIRMGAFTYGASTSVDCIAGVGAYRLKGYIQEIIMVSASVFSASQDEIEGYLAWKWDKINGNTTLSTALPSGHKYKSSPPYV